MQLHEIGLAISLMRMLMPSDKLFIVPILLVFSSHKCLPRYKNYRLRLSTSGLRTTRTTLAQVTVILVLGIVYIHLSRRI